MNINYLLNSKLRKTLNAKVRFSVKHLIIISLRFGLVCYVRPFGRNYAGNYEILYVGDIMITSFTENQTLKK